MTTRYAVPPRQSDLERLAQLQAEIAILRCRLAHPRREPGVLPLHELVRHLSLSEIGEAVIRHAIALTVTEKTFTLDLPTRFDYLDIDPLVTEVEIALNRYFLGRHRPLKVNRVETGHPLCIPTKSATDSKRSRPGNPRQAGHP